MRTNNKIQNKTNRRAVTLVEVVLSLTASSIVVLAAGSLLIDNQKGWEQMYNRIYSDVVTDSYVVRHTFGTVVRKASVRKCLIGNQNEYAEVYYYQDPINSNKLDAYARFYVNNGQLKLDTGSLDQSTWETSNLNTVTLANDVASVVFSESARCVKMDLTLDNGTESMEVNCSVNRLNE